MIAHFSVVDPYIQTLFKDWSKRTVFENARMITISVFKNIHYGQAIDAMLGERASVVAKLKFVDELGGRNRKPKKMRSEITPLEWELGKRPHNEEQRRPARAFYREHKELQEQNNMRGIQSRVTGHEVPHEQVREIFFLSEQTYLWGCFLTTVKSRTVLDDKKLLLAKLCSRALI